MIHLLKKHEEKNIGGFEMIGRKKAIFDVILALMAYLIFALSLIAVNVVKYPGILIAFYVILISSGLMILLSVRNFNKYMK